MSASVQSMAVVAGFSSGAASETAKAQTRATAFVAALGLNVLFVFSGNFVAQLPKPVLAAEVIAALTQALDSRPLTSVALEL